MRMGEKKLNITNNSELPFLFISIPTMVVICKTLKHLFTLWGFFLYMKSQDAWRKENISQL